MTGQIESFLAVLEDQLLDLTPVEFKGMQLTEEDMIELCYFKFQEIPLLSRMHESKIIFRINMKHFITGIFRRKRRRFYKENLIACM